MIPIYELISEEEVISRIKVDLRLVDTTEHDTHLEILLREGLGSMNCISQLEQKQYDLVVEDGMAKLPKELVKFIALRPKMWKAQDPAHPHHHHHHGDHQHWGQMIYSDTNFLSNCGVSHNGHHHFSKGFLINKGFIHFNNNFGITQATVAYLGMWLDKDGKRAIFERFERALTAYACWKFTRSWPEKYNQYIMESYKTEWMLQRDKMKGMDVKTEFDENKLYISGIMRAFLVSPIVVATNAS